MLDCQSHYEKGLPVDANDLKRLCQIYSIMDQDILADQDYLKSDIRFHIAIAECTHNMVIPKLLHIVGKLEMRGLYNRESFEDSALEDYAF